MYFQYVTWAGLWDGVQLRRSTFRTTAKIFESGGGADMWISFNIGRLSGADTPLRGFCIIAKAQGPFCRIEKRRKGCDPAKEKRPARITGGALNSYKGSGAWHPEAGGATSLRKSSREPAITCEKAGRLSGTGLKPCGMISPPQEKITSPLRSGPRYFLPPMPRTAPTPT